MKLLKTVILIVTFSLHFLFAQSIKIHTSSGVNEFNISDIDSITFTIIPDTVDLTRGLVAYYPFSGNADDSSGNDNHGTVYGAVLAEDRYGNSNSAYIFDGTDDFIDIGNNQSLKPQFPVSISCWINITSSGMTLPVFANNHDMNNNYSGIWLNISPINRISVGYGDGNAIGPNSRRTKVSNTIPSQAIWYHVVGIIRDSLDMEIYINGTNDGGTYSGNGGVIYYNNDPANIGRLDSSVSGGPSSYFNGRIDELRFYNRELNEQEIQALYNQ